MARSSYLRQITGRPPAGVPTLKPPSALLRRWELVHVPIRFEARSRALPSWANPAQLPEPEGWPPSPCLTERDLVHLATPAPAVSGSDLTPAPVKPEVLPIARSREEKHMRAVLSAGGASPTSDLAAMRASSPAAKVALAEAPSGPAMPDVPSAKLQPLSQGPNLGDDAPQTLAPSRSAQAEPVKVDFEATPKVSEIRPAQRRLSRRQAETHVQTNEARARPLADRESAASSRHTPAPGATPCDPISVSSPPAGATLVPRVASSPTGPTQKRQTSSGTAVHIGTVEVRITPPPLHVQVAPHPAQATPVPALSRGFTSSLGLRQG